MVNETDSNRASRADEFDDDQYDDDVGFDPRYDPYAYMPPYAITANLNRLGYALARSQTQTAVGVSQLIGGVLTTLIDAGFVASRPFQPYAGYDPYGADPYRGGAPPPSQGQGQAGSRRRDARGDGYGYGPAAATGVVTDGLNQAVADALYTSSRAAQDFASSYAPFDPRGAPPRREAPAGRHKRSARADVRQAADDASAASDDAASRVQGDAARARTPKP